MIPDLKSLIRPARRRLDTMRAAGRRYHVTIAAKAAARRSQRQTLVVTDAGGFDSAYFSSAFAQFIVGLAMAWMVASSITGVLTAIQPFLTDDARPAVTSAPTAAPPPSGAHTPDPVKPSSPTQPVTPLPLDVNVGIATVVSGTQADLINQARCLQDANVIGSMARAPGMDLNIYEPGFIDHTAAETPLPVAPLLTFVAAQDTSGFAISWSVAPEIGRAVTVCEIDETHTGPPVGRPGQSPVPDAPPTTGPFITAAYHPAAAPDTTSTERTPVWSGSGTYQLRAGDKLQRISFVIYDPQRAPGLGATLQLNLKADLQQTP